MDISDFCTNRVNKLENGHAFDQMGSICYKCRRMTFLTGDFKQNCRITKVLCEKLRFLTSEYRKNSILGFWGIGG